KDDQNPVDIRDDDFRTGRLSRSPPHQRARALLDPLDRPGLVRPVLRRDLYPVARDDPIADPAVESETAPKYRLLNTFGRIDFIGTAGGAQDDAAQHAGPWRSKKHPPPIAGGASWNCDREAANNGFLGGERGERDT